DRFLRSAPRDGDRDAPADGAVALRRAPGTGSRRVAAAGAEAAGPVLAAVGLLRGGRARLAFVPAVETFSRLLSGFPFRDHLLQDRRRSEPFAGKLGRERLGDREPDVQPDEVARLQRSHAVAI